MRQVWFRGVHTDIGGGYDQHGAADLAFLWMASQVARLLDLDPASIAYELDRTEPWCAGTLHESRTFLYRIMAKAFQRPVCGSDTEFVHESVFARPGFHGVPVNRREPFSEFERSFAWQVQPTSPPREPFSARHDGVCDTIVRWLGGG